MALSVQKIITKQCMQHECHETFKNLKCLGDTFSLQCIGKPFINIMYLIEIHIHTADTLKTKLIRRFYEDLSIFASLLRE